MDDVSQVIVLTEETKVLLVKCLLLLDEKEVIGAIKLGGISCSPPPTPDPGESEARCCSLPGEAGPRPV